MQNTNSGGNRPPRRCRADTSARVHLTIQTQAPQCPLIKLNWIPPGASLDVTAVILHFHSLHSRELAGNGAVVDHLQEELDVRKHDARGACDDKVDVLIAFLLRLDLTGLKLALQAIGFSDKASAIHAGKVGEVHDIRTPFAGEYLGALVSTRRPRAEEIERIGVLP